MRNTLRKKIKKNQGGITLIALVITIIVLLILAGVAISMLSGENGLLQQATNAKSTMKAAEIEESLKLAVLASYGRNGKIEESKLKEELKKLDLGSADELPAALGNENHKFIVDSKGNIKAIEEGATETHVDLALDVAKLMKPDGTVDAGALAEELDIEINEFPVQIEKNGEKFKVYEDGTVTKETVSDEVPDEEDGELEIVNFGDSIFGMFREEFGSEESVSALISEMTGATCYNAGFGGCRMTKRDGYYDAFSMYAVADSVASGSWTTQENAIASAKTDSSYENSVLTTGYFSETVNMLKGIEWDDIDIITIGYGTNDFTAGKNYGYSSDYENNYNLEYFADALEYSINKIKEEYPDIKIYVVTPMYRWYNEGTFSDCTTVKNDIDALLSNYVDTCKNVAEKLNVEIIDNYTELGINSENYINYFTATDGTHPSIHGRIRVAENIATHLAGTQKTYNKKYLYLKPLVDKNGDWFFGDSSIKSEQIVSFNIITNSVSEPNGTPTKSWPVSITNNDSIMMYLYETGENTGNYDAYLCANSQIYTPNDATCMFAYLKNIPSLDLTGINTEYSSNMHRMFRNVGIFNTSFTELDLGDAFDTSRVTNMNGMFLSCGRSSGMTELNLGEKFITNNVTDFNNMFYACGENAIESFNLGKLIIPSTATTTSMFDYRTGKSGCTVIVSNEALKSTIETMKTNDSSNTWKIGTVQVAN